MRPRIAIGAVALLLCACGTSSAQSPGSATSATTGATTPAGRTDGPACGPPGARTLAGGRLARVYVRHGLVVACTRGSSHRFRLGAATGGPGAARVGPVAVNGRMAAYAVERSEVDTGTAALVVRRLTDGATLATVRPAILSPVRPESYVIVTAVVVTRAGAATWISVAASILSHTRTVDVDALDRHGVRRLDGGGGVVSGSLRLRGRTVRWRNGAQWRSATLAS